MIDILIIGSGDHAEEIKRRIGHFLEKEGLGADVEINIVDAAANFCKSGKFGPRIMVYSREKKEAERISVDLKRNLGMCVGYESSDNPNDAS